jgi:V/A-type H+-transporting ATPase subunit A
VAWAGSFSRDAESLAVGRSRAGDPEWAHRRQRVLALLADADRLAALAELVGAGALPASERVVILAGRLLREAVLQQSALSATDGFCSAEKGAALVDAVLAVVDRCDALVDSGVPAAAVEQVDFGPLVRARDETGPDDVDGCLAHRDAVLALLEELA